MKSTLKGILVAGLGTIAIMSLPTHSRADESVADKAEVCGGCHGEDGVPADKSIPVLWGQNEGYIYLQLRDFKLGNRASEIMGAIVAGLSKQDMQTLAALFAAKPWPALDQTRAPKDAAARFADINTSGQCTACHLDGYVGSATVPRLAGQNHDYLIQTMSKFRSGERANNPWMNALLKTYTDADIAAIALYLAGL